MKRGKRIETPELPESMIQHIQSFLNGKEAARTTILSKSWHSAWLTRPTLDLDQRHFKDPHRRIFPKLLLEFALKTLERCFLCKLKIDTLRLRLQNHMPLGDSLLSRLIVISLAMGATHLDLNLYSSPPLLPPEVLRSESLLRLSVKGCGIHGGSAVNCSMLRSLTLSKVIFGNCDIIRDIICCCISIEELSLSNCSYSEECVNSPPLSETNLHRLLKLRRLYLEKVAIDASFFDGGGGFVSRFPCLKDVSLVRCHGFGTILISSTSLQRISIVQQLKVKLMRVELNVPNLACFSYSGMAMDNPSLISINATKFESYVSLRFNGSLPASLCHQSLVEKLLAQLSPSETNALSLDLVFSGMWSIFDEAVVAGPVEVENLIIETKFGSVCEVVVGLFRLCRPKVLTHYWLPKSYKSSYERNNSSVKELCRNLMQEVIAPHIGVPDVNMFGCFGLTQVKIEVYKENRKEWRPVVFKEPLDTQTPPPNKQKICFHLKW